MSDTITIDDATAQTIPERKSEGDRAREKLGIETRGPAISVEEGATSSFEDTLAATTRALKEADTEREALRARASNAEAEAARARGHAATATTARHADQLTTAAALVESSKSEMTSAQAALRSAYEANDPQAIVTAQTELNAASYRFHNATSTLETMKATRPRQPDPNARQGGGTSPEVQKWMDEHPRFHSDRVYKGVAEGAHFEAIERGMQEGSKSYFDHINGTLDRHFKEAPKVDTPNRGNDTGLSPSRGGGSGGGESSTHGERVNTPFGELIVSRQGNTQTVRIPPGRMEDWKEAAAINRMPLGDYVKEQIAAGREIAAGGTGGLITGEGRTYK
jgi:hypothetical protein